MATNSVWYGSKDTDVAIYRMGKGKGGRDGIVYRTLSSVDVILRARRFNAIPAAGHSGRPRSSCVERRNIRQTNVGDVDENCCENMLVCITSIALANNVILEHNRWHLSRWVLTRRSSTRFRSRFLCDACQCSTTAKCRDTTRCMTNDDNEEGRKNLIIKAPSFISNRVTGG